MMVSTFDGTQPERTEEQLIVLLEDQRDLLIPSQQGLHYSGAR
jgi:hypothetical protein